MISPEDVSLAGKSAIVTGGARGNRPSHRLGPRQLRRRRRRVRPRRAQSAANAWRSSNLLVVAPSPRCSTSAMPVPSTSSSAASRRSGARSTSWSTTRPAPSTHTSSTRAPRVRRSLVDENFGSVTNFVRAAVPVMPAGGSIINVTSIEAHRAGITGTAADEVGDTAEVLIDHRRLTLGARVEEVCVEGAGHVVHDDVDLALLLRDTPDERSTPPALRTSITSAMVRRPRASSFATV